jgi:hypothetical protein
MQAQLANCYVSKISSLDVSPWVGVLKFSGHPHEGLRVRFAIGQGPKVKQFFFAGLCGFAFKFPALCCDE